MSCDPALTPDPSRDSDAPALWAACPPGTLRALAEARRQTKRVRTLIRSSVAVAAVLFGASLGIYLGSPGVERTGDPPRPFVSSVPNPVVEVTPVVDNFTGPFRADAERPLTCPEIRELAPEFRDAKLTTRVVNQVRNHLGRCGGCKHFYEAQGISVAACSCAPPHLPGAPAPAPAPGPPAGPDFRLPADAVIASRTARP